MHTDRQMVALSWKDNNLVTMISTASDSWKPGVQVLRRLKKGEWRGGQLITPAVGRYLIGLMFEVPQPPRGARPNQRLSRIVGLIGLHVDVNVMCVGNPKPGTARVVVMSGCAFDEIATTYFMIRSEELS